MSPPRTPIPDELAELQRRQDALTAKVQEAMEAGRLIGCAECGDPITDELLVLVYPTERRTIREVVVHPGCPPREVLDGFKWLSADQ